MSDVEPNPFTEPLAHEVVVPSVVKSHRSRCGRFRTISLVLIFFGVVTGIVGLALVSNQFGNTDTLGLPVVGLGGMALCWGFCSLFMKFRHAFLIGIAAVPLSIILLFAFYWVFVILAAVSRA